MRILVVDDAEDIRITTKLLLEFEGHAVEVAADGALGVMAASQRPPDLILMDLSMPVMDGFTATRHLRALPQTRLVPIVAVSAYVHDKVWCDRALAAGADECLGKPLEHDRLGAILTRLSRGGASAESHRLG